MMQNTISHPGIITTIHDDRVEVTIISLSACASCQAKGTCSASEVAEKIVVVDRPPNRDFRTGDQVTVVMDRSAGLRAVMYGYFLPFILLMVVLFVANGLTESQGLSGLIALGSLAPYYLILWFMRNRMKSRFQFRLGE